MPVFGIITVEPEDLKLVAGFLTGLLAVWVVPRWKKRMTVVEADSKEVDTALRLVEALDKYSGGLQAKISHLQTRAEDKDKLIAELQTGLRAEQVRCNGLHADLVKVRAELDQLKKVVELNHPSKPALNPLQASLELPGI